MSQEGDASLHQLCRLAGLATEWSDIFGRRHEVAAEDLRAVLAALGLGSDDPAAMRARIAELEAEQASLPPLITAEAGETVAVRLPPGPFRITLEGGGTVEGVSEPDGASCRLTAPAEPGYHRLESAGHSVTLATAPARCFTVGDALARDTLGGDALGGDAEAPRPQGRRVAWGIAVQLYALRRAGDGGIGDFVALARFAEEAAAHGASALAISPVHAQFSADIHRFSPYAPSSRVMLNVLHASSGALGDGGRALEAEPLVDWPAAGAARLAQFRTVFDEGAAEDPAFQAWRAEQGGVLEGHALFEALHAHIYARDRQAWHWRDWPAEYASPEAPGIEAFRREHEREITWHAWMQYQADRQIAAAQEAARRAGMAIGLISDLAVGTDSGGSHCWTHPDETLRGLTLGAPPDLLQPRGQNWGITAFSARGLRQNGFRAFIEMLRGAMRHAGGVRIDHAMGITRLWIIPDGLEAARGTYLALPEDDLRRLIKLESVRNRAIVLAEDLGTVPEGFPERLQQAGIDGMRVLAFERNDDGFTPPRGWTRQAAAMTSTHDLATVAGWWTGHDIDTRAAIFSTKEDDVARERADREGDRGQLWAAMRQSGAASGEQPAAWDADPVVDAALAHVARAGCELAMLPIEDVLGLREQPNLPGTTNEHPNWRRRLEQPSGSVLDNARTKTRLAAIDGIRGAGAALD